MGPIESGGLIAEDMAQLVAYEHRKRVGPVTTALEEVLGSFEAYDRCVGPFDKIERILISIAVLLWQTSSRWRPR